MVEVQSKTLFIHLIASAQATWREVETCGLPDVVWGNPLRHDTYSLNTD